jgi:hypothetical protein
MPRRAAASTNVIARIRAWFGLRQDELALYLAISPELVRSVEAGRRRLTLPVTEALLPLLRELPPSETAAPPLTSLPPDTPVPDAGELDFRRRVCLQRAVKLRAQAEKLVQKAHYGQRWAQARPALLPPSDAPDAERASWLTGWLERRARPLSTEEVTRWHLLQAQALAYETEAAALAKVV